MPNRRVEAFIEVLAAQGAQAAILLKPSNVRYFSGYTGEGLLVVTPEGATVVTDFRYVEAAQRQAPDCDVRRVEHGGHEAAAVEVLSRAGVATAAFEDDILTVRGMRRLCEAAPEMRFEPLETRPETLRAVKDANEIAAIEEACDITCRAFERILQKIRPGMTEREVAFALENEMRSLGAEGTAFSTIVAAGSNGSLPHAEPGDRPIERGMLVTMDFGARVRGYCADMTRTVAVGEPGAEQRRIYAGVLEAHLRAMKAIRPGAVCREVDAVARDYLKSLGWEFGHSLGHGVGLDIHEEPRLSARSADTLQAGHVVTDEPGVYLPGKCGCRIEDSVLVTKDGCRSLTPAAKELIIL